MAAKTGRSVVVTNAGGGLICSGLRTKSVRINNEPIDITSDDDAGFLALLPDEVAQHAVDITLEGTLSDGVLLQRAISRSLDFVLNIDCGGLAEFVVACRMVSYVVNGGYRGALTFRAEFQSSGRTPAAPVLSGEAGEDHESVDLSWTVPDSEEPIAGYRLYRAEDDSLLVDQAGTTFSDTGLEFDTDYSYYVVAYTEFSPSINSNVVTVNTGHPPTITDTFAPGGITIWTKRAHVLSLDVVVIGGGGGGAAGSTNPGTGGHHGSIGGTGGGFASFSIDASYLASTEVVTAGAGGAGGAPTTVSFGGGGGHVGSAGAASSFGAWATAQGGLGGNADPGTGQSIENLGGQASITASPGPTSKVTERGGLANSAGGGGTTRSGAGGGTGAYASGGRTTGGGCANSGVPYFGGDGGDGGEPFETDAAGHPGTSGVPYGSGGGAGGDANKSNAFPIVSYGTGAGGAGTDGVVIVINYMD